MGEALAHERLEMREGQRVIRRVEAGLVPLVGEALTEREPLLTPILLAGVGVTTEVVGVVTSLEILMRAEDVVHLIADVRPEKLGRDARLIGNTDRLATAMAQLIENHHIVPARTLN